MCDEPSVIKRVFKDGYSGIRKRRDNMRMEEDGLLLAWMMEEGAIRRNGTDFKAYLKKSKKDFPLELRDRMQTSDLQSCKTKEIGLYFKPLPLW